MTDAKRLPGLCCHCQLPLEFPAQSIGLTAPCPFTTSPKPRCSWPRRRKWVRVAQNHCLDDRGDTGYRRGRRGAAHRAQVPAKETGGTACTYSKSPGLLSMPTLGGAIHGANFPISYCGVISEAMKSPSAAVGSQSGRHRRQVARIDQEAVGRRLDVAKFADLAMEGDVRQRQAERIAGKFDHLVPAQEALGAVRV